MTRFTFLDPHGNRVSLSLSPEKRPVWAYQPYEPLWRVTMTTALRGDDGDVDAYQHQQATLPRRRGLWERWLVAWLHRRFEDRP
jgi:hypothetical protein